MVGKGRGNSGGKAINACTIEDLNRATIFQAIFRFLLLVVGVTLRTTIIADGSNRAGNATGDILTFV